MRLPNDAGRRRLISTTTSPVTTSSRSRNDTAVEAAEECPFECIMIEPYDQAAIDARGA